MTEVGPTTNNWLGRNGYPDVAFDGLMDDVRVYTSALSAADVAAIHKEGTAEVPVTVTVQPRCIAGKAYLAVRVLNDHNSAVDVVMETRYGNRSFADVAPGAAAFQSFAVRAAAVPAGSVTVRATATVGGNEVTTTVNADYAAETCGS
jgi:hypothetical protein